MCAFLISLFCLFCFSFRFAKLNSQSVWSLTDGSNAELAEKPLMVVRLVPKVPNTTQKLGNGQWTFFAYEICTFNPACIQVNLTIKSLCTCCERQCCVFNPLNFQLQNFHVFLVRAIESEG